MNLASAICWAIILTKKINVRKKNALLFYTLIIIDVKKKKIVDIYKNNKQPSTHFKNCKLKRSNFLLDKEKRILIIFRLI